MFVRKPRAWMLSRRDLIGYDEFDAKVIIAMTEQDARKLANENVGDEGEIWDDVGRVECVEVILEGEYELIGSFNAG